MSFAQESGPVFGIIGQSFVEREQMMISQSESDV